MSDVALFKSGRTPQYLRSVHTPLYLGDPDAIINPDVSALIGVVPLKYWKRSGSTVSEMNTTEKQAIAAAEAAEVDTAVGNFEVDIIPIVKAIIQIGNQKWSQGLTVTPQEVKTIIKGFL